MPSNTLHRLAALPEWVKALPVPAALVVAILAHLMSIVAGPEGKRHA